MLAGIRPVQAGQDIEQGRLAGTVRADEAVNFTGANMQRHVLQRRQAAEMLGYAADA